MSQCSPALDFLDQKAPRPDAVEGLFMAALLGASAFAGLFVGAAPPQAAEPISPMAQGLLGMPVSEQALGAQRFVTPDGVLRFTLDRSLNAVALMRFDGHGEVLALTPTPGPHGDEFLKDDTGRVVVRVTAVGGLIVYADAAGTGAPASLEGRATPLAGPALPSGGLSARLAEIERETARAVGRPIAFDAPPGYLLTNSAAVGLVADAAARTAEGLAVVRPAHLSRVTIQLGPRAAAHVTPDVLRVTIAPALGYAGRPSAEAIATVLRAVKR